MRLPLLFLVLLFPLYATLAAGPVDVYTDASGLTVQIDGLAARIDHRDSTPVVRMVTSRSLVPSPDAPFDAVELLIAIPDGPLPAVDLVVGGETPVGVLNAPGTIQTPRVELVPVGIQRGVRLASLSIHPYRVDASGRVAVMHAGRVYVRFATPLDTRPTAPAPDLRSFASVVNREQIAALRRSAPVAQALATLDEGSTWYTKDAVFVRMATTRDGVARATYDDVAAVEPAFAGVPVDRLRLLHNGVEYPYAVLNDNDAVFGPGDELLFFGRRAYGDTTWFDAYTTECSFFLTVSDGTAAPLRLSDYQQPASTAAVLGVVGIDRHIERDREYHLGDDVDNNHISTLHRSQTAPGEGWYWGEFSYDPANRNNFQHVEIMTPSENPADTLRIGYHYHAKSNNRLKPNHMAEYGLNGWTLGTDTPFSGYGNVSFATTVDAASLLSGANQLRLRAPGVPGNRDSANYTEVSALDYFTIQGQVQPYAWQGVLDFAVGGLVDHALVPVRGFSAPVVYGIDTLRRVLVRLDGQPGTTVRAGARSGEQAVVSLTVNDTVAVYSAKPGLALALLKPSDNGRVEAAVYPDPQASRQEIADRLQQAPTGSVIAVASAGVELPSELRSLFQSMGSVQVQNASALTSWVYAVRKGTAPSIDRAAQGTAASGSAFIVHDGGRSFAADLRLSGSASGESYRWMMSDAGAVERAAVARVQPVDLRDRTLQADVIIITHRNFAAQADSLARYRRARNGMAVQVVDVDDIYKQFSYGRKSPHAIRQFLAYAYAQWAPPALQYLVLFGDASWDARNVSADAIMNDYVPTYGRPVSDYWYTLVDGDDLLPEFTVGRISVDNAEQAQAVVDKIVEYEALPKRPWMKNVLLLSGGQGADERRRFRNNTLLQIENHLLSAPLCTTIDTVFKDNDDQASVSQATPIRNKINAGAVWVSYVGHASPVTFDMDFGFASDLNNGNKYPVLATYSCQTAAFGEPNVTGKNEDFVRAAGRGFIGAFGTTGFGEVNIDYGTAGFLYEAMRYDTLRRLGDMLFQAKTRMAPFSINDLTYQNTLYQHSLIGDPLLEIAIEPTVDFYLLQEDIAVVNEDNSSVISENDSVVTVSSWLRNAGMQGKFLDENEEPLPVEVLFVHEYEGQRDSTWLRYSEVCFDIPFALQLRIAGQPGVHYLALYADPQSYSPETDRSNNAVFDTLIVYPARAFALDPLPYWNVNAQAPVFRIVNPLAVGTLALEFAVSADGTADNPLLTSGADDVDYREAYTEWRPATRLAAGASYWLHVRTRDGEGEYGAWVDMPFTASENIPTTTVEWTLRREAHFAAGQVTGLTTREQGDSVELFLDNYTVPVTLRSNGNSTTRDLLIEVDGTTIVDWATYRTGFNLAVLPRGSAMPRAYRWYYTFPFPNPAAEYNSSDLIRFLRDSVSDGETILLAAYDEAFVGPLTTDKNLDTLADVLKLYGSQITDSLFGEGGWRAVNSSYVLVAQRGALLAEAWKKDTVEKTGVEIVTDITIEGLAGGIATPVAGPATQWNSVQLARYGDDDGVTWNVTVIGRTSAGSEVVLATVASTTVDLSTVDATTYPYLRFLVELSRETSGYKAVLTGLRCTFTPTAEFAALAADSGPLTNDVLRGEEVVVHSRVQNISRRVASVPSRLHIDLRSGNTEPVQFAVAVPSLPPDAVHGQDVTVQTALLEALSSINVAVYAADEEEELYLFNNRQQYDLRLYEDTVKPVITLEMDGQVVRENDYVALRPATRIRIADNSPMRITSSDRVVVRLNGKYLDSNEPPMENYTFTALASGDDHAHVEFTALLDPGYNFVRVVAEDVAGNRDTLDVTFIVAEQPIIKRLTSAPNPFGEQTSISFIVGDSEKPTGGDVVIYNTAGRLVRRMTFEPRIGLNTFEWDGTDEAGAVVSDGVYLLRMYIRGSGGLLESQTQKMVRIR